MPDSASGSLNSNSNLPGGNNGSSKNEIGGFGLFDGISNPVVGNSNQEKQVATKVITETKIVRPKVVEIRVFFYDDQTFESFCAVREAQCFTLNIHDKMTEGSNFTSLSHCLYY